MAWQQFTAETDCNTSSSCSTLDLCTPCCYSVGASLCSSSWHGVCGSSSAIRARALLASGREFWPLRVVEASRRRGVEESRAIRAAADGSLADAPWPSDVRRSSAVDAAQHTTAQHSRAEQPRWPSQRRRPSGSAPYAYASECVVHGSRGRPVAVQPSACFWCAKRAGKTGAEDSLAPPPSVSGPQRWPAPTAVARASHEPALTASCVLRRSRQSARSRRAGTACVVDALRT